MSVERGRAQALQAVGQFRATRFRRLPNINQEPIASRAKFGAQLFHPTPVPASSATVDPDQCHRPEFRSRNRTYGAYHSPPLQFNQRRPLSQGMLATCIDARDGHGLLYAESL